MASATAGNDSGDGVQTDLIPKDAWGWSPLLRGILLRRYKRFMADVKLDNGEIVTAHCANSGRMQGCCTDGQPVYLSYHDSPKRKLKYSWQLIEMPESLVGINTMVPNHLAARAICNNKIAALCGYDRLEKEVKVDEHSRLDIRLTGKRRRPCYIEVKNCTLVEGSIARFPDAVTKRGQKHLFALEKLVSRGARGVIFYLIQRMDAHSFEPAENIDPEYAKILRKVSANGVEILVYDVRIDLTCIRIHQPVPYELSFSGEL